MKSSFEINGGNPVNGTLHICGNKNAVLPMIAAALLTDETVILRNVPDILDVDKMAELARSLGVCVESEPGILRLNAAGLEARPLSRELCTAIRTSMLFAGPLLARKGSAVFYPPGGDVIGRRRLDTHFYALTKLGANLESSNPYTFRAEMPLKGAELFFDEASVTGTEHLLLTAVLAQGTTVLYNAAAEPHVQDLGEMLNQMGADITGLGTNTLTIQGVEKLHGVEYTIAGDHIEAGSFLTLAAAAGGGITLKGIRPRHYWMQRRIFERFNLELTFTSDSVTLPPGQILQVHNDIGNAVPVISDGPWPQYPSDMMACTLVMATQAQGTVLFFEKMFESRIYFVDRLIAMGANAIVCDPHRAVISGPTPLSPAIILSPDIRAGMAMVIAALCAHGTSVIRDAQIIDRGYANLPERLQSIGCSIRRIQER